MYQNYYGYDAISDTIVFELDTINTCNFNCPYCEKQKNKWNPNKDEEEWNKIGNITKLIPFFKSFPYKFRLHLLGGEPTLYPNLEDFLEELPDADIKLFTNGSKLDKLEKLAVHRPSITVSIHREYKLKYLMEFIEKGLHKKFKNVKFLILLYSLDINLNKYMNYIDIIIKNGINFDYYFPFDENGNYRHRFPREIENYQILKEKYPLKFDHYKIYENRDNLSQKKLCSKNLWLIDYKSNFRFDGDQSRDISFNEIKTIVESKDFSKFKFEQQQCNTPCWCPANNYYSKIRLPN